MASLADPDELDVVAARIERHADQLRERASRLVAAADAVGWHSVAAGAFRAEVGGVAAAFRRAADRVDDAAHALRRHAATVRRVQDLLAAAERAADAGAHGLEHLAGDALHLVGL